MFNSSLPIKLNYFLELSVHLLSSIENVWSMLAQRLAGFPPPAATPDQLWQYVEAAWTAVPQKYIQSLLDSMQMRVAAVMANNGGYTS
ncbi:transposable element Tcb1 transposase [Trichonephila clavipes]|nr:transposable element Tcb1 transposase [Trichonephila clavipes]